MKSRINNGRPWHSPSHAEGRTRHHLTAACYEHRPIIGATESRMRDFEATILDILGGLTETVHAWAILPNHYHVLVGGDRILEVVRALGRMHGRLSHQWNGEDSARGRKVWFNVLETGIKSDRHFWACVNYIHHNPVRHGYVSKWDDWPFSSAAAYLKTVGRERAKSIWREYDISDMGADWDAKDM